MHTCAFSLSIFMLHSYKWKTGSCSGTCASGICYTHRDEMRTCAFSLLSSCPCYTKQKLRDWYLLKDEMRTYAFSLSIFMSLLYKSRNERLVVTQGRDAHLCLLAFYLHVLLLHNCKWKTGSCSGTCASGICCTHRDEMRTSAISIFIFMSLLHKTKVRDW